MHIIKEEVNAEDFPDIKSKEIEIVEIEIRLFEKKVLIYKEYLERVKLCNTSEELDEAVGWIEDKEERLDTE